MAIARDATSSGSTTGTSLTISHTISGTNRMLFVMPNEDATGLTATRITGVTYNGVAMTKLAETYRTFSSGFVTTLWGLAAPATGTHDIVISLSASDGISSQNASFTGCDQTLPTGNALKTFSSNANATCSFSPVSIADNSWAIARCIGLDGATVNGTNFVGYGFSNNSGGDSNAGLGTSGTETVDATQALSGVRWGGCVCGVFAPVVSTTTTLNLSELLTLQRESTSRTWNAPRSPFDIITITETIQGIKGRIIEILETLGINESLGRTWSATRSFSESVGITERFSGVTTYIRGLIETQTIIEYLVASIQIIRTLVLSEIVTIIEYVRFPLNWLKRTKPTTTWTPRTKP